jgi:hypothetical protein
MDLVSNQRARTFNSAAVNALSHPLAFVDNVPLKRLLKLRASEGEAFNVYRDSVRQVLNNAQGKSSRELREAFEDQIRPELNKIELTIKNTRRLTALSTLTDVTVLFAAISIAAFSGLLPVGLIPRDILNVGAMLGGWQGVRGLASKLSTLRSVPKEAAENRFVFLWRIQRKASTRRQRERAV